MLRALTSLLYVPKDIIAGFFHLFSSKEIRKCATAPLKLGFISFLISVVCFYYFRNDIAGLLAHSSSSALHTLLVWGLFFFSIVVSGFFAVIATVIGGAFYFDKLALLLFKERGQVTGQLNSSFREEVIRVLQFSAVRILFGLTWLVLFLVSLVLPVLAIPVTVLGIYLLGVDALSSPLAVLLSTSHASRIGGIYSASMRHLLDTFVIGVLFSATLLIPLGGIVLLPLLYSFTVQRVCRWEELAQS